MSETLQPIYVPCEILRVRAMVSTHDVLTPIEKLAIEAVGKSRAAPTFSMSASFMPRVVRAGVPKRTPPGFSALTSPGTVFLLTLM